jgi:hypothetical protein
VSDLSVLNGLVGHGELSEVLTDHLSLDFTSGPVFSRVNFTNGADHLGHDDGVTEVGLDGLGLFTVGGVLDGGLKLLDESVVLGVHSVLEPPSLSRLEKSDDLCGIKFEELIELDSSVNLLLEWFSLGNANGGSDI